MTDCKLNPLDDRVVILPDPPVEILVGKLFPGKTKEKVKYGTVVKVGPGKMKDGKRLPMYLNVGDRVMFGAYGGLDSDDGKYRILDEGEVLARITTNAKS